MRFRRKELLQIAFRRPARCNLILMKKRSAGDAHARVNWTGTSLSRRQEASAKVARQRMVNVSGRNRSMAGSDGDLMKIRDHVADGI